MHYNILSMLIICVYIYSLIYYIIYVIYMCVYIYNLSNCKPYNEKTSTKTKTKFPGPFHP